MMPTWAVILVSIVGTVVLLGVGTFVLLLAYGIGYRTGYLDHARHLPPRVRGPRETA